jgi:beta-xylosidase
MVNFWTVPNLLTQKFPAPNFTATTKITFTPRANDEETGLIVTGIDYAYISLKKTAKGLVVAQTVCTDAEHGRSEIKTNEVLINSNTIYFKVAVKNVLPTDADYKQFDKSENSPLGNAKCSFTEIGTPFGAKKGKWIGATVGLFAIRKGVTYETGYADIDWFRVSK